MTAHDCGHQCCQQRANSLHDHFADPHQCPRCRKAAEQRAVAAAYTSRFEAVLDDIANTLNLRSRNRKDSA